jgi:hypothetical protein
MPQQERTCRSRPERLCTHYGNCRSTRVCRAVSQDACAGQSSPQCRAVRACALAATATNRTLTLCTEVGLCSSATDTSEQCTYCQAQAGEFFAAGESFGSSSYTCSLAGFQTKDQACVTLIGTTLASIGDCVAIASHYPKFEEGESCLCFCMLTPTSSPSGCCNHCCCLLWLFSAASTSCCYRFAVYVQAGQRSTSATSVHGPCRMTGAALSSPLGL